MPKPTSRKAKKKENELMKRRVSDIEDQISILKSTLTRKLSPLQMEGEPEDLYAHFIRYCQLGGTSYSLQRYARLLHNNEARLEDRPLTEFKEVPNWLRSACEGWKWNDRFKEWNETLLGIEYLENKKETQLVLRVVESQIASLDEAFQDAEEYLKVLKEIPISQLKPTLKDVASLTRTMVEVAKLRRDFIPTPESKIEEAIATLTEASLLPDEVLRQANENLVNFYDAQKAAISRRNLN